MASQDRGKERGSRKLMKKRKEPGKETRGMSLDIPERFKDGDDAQEDVTAPKRNDTMSMNQSLFSMIARAGQQSQVDLGSMQGVDSADSDEDGKGKTPFRSLDGAARLSRLSTRNDFQAPLESSEVEEKGQTKQHRRALSENKLLRSLPKLRMSSKKEARAEVQHADPMSSSQFLPPRPSVAKAPEAPDSEQTSRAKIRTGPSADIHVDKVRKSERGSRQGSSGGLAKSKGPVMLATRIQQIFEFEDVEEVISEYPCWLLQSILLQGYMYITQKHICFYAYIPKKHVRPAPSHDAHFVIAWSNFSSMTSARQATCPSAGGQSTTDIGSSCVGMCYHTIQTPPSSTFRETASTCNMPYQPKPWIARRKAKRRLHSWLPLMKETINSKLTVQRARRNGSGLYRRLFFAPIMKAIVSRYRYQSRTLSRSRRVQFWTSRTRSKSGLLTTARPSQSTRYDSIDTLQDHF